MQRTLVAIKDVRDCFTKGKTYTAIYIPDPQEDNGWVTQDDMHREHWLCRKDGRDYRNIEKLPYVTDNFIILPTT